MDTTEIFAKLDEFRRAGKSAALVIITNTSGSTPRKAGSKMIVAADGAHYGTVGGGASEQKIITEARRIISSGNPGKMKLDLKKDTGMHCGGSMEVYIEPIAATQKLVIFGAGHVGAALANYAVDFGFWIRLVDHRPELFDPLSEKGFDIICEDYVSTAKKIDPDENTYIVVTTPQHAYDQEVTGILGKKKFRYLGMIGSKKKVALARKHYLNNNILNESQIEKIDMPIGIPFNAQTPQEIAISILAKLIDVKNS